MDERSGTAFGNLGRRAVAWIILLAVAILAIKVVIGVLAGLVTAVVWAVIGVLVVVGVLWALKHL